MKIETKRLFLREYEPKDADTLVKSFADFDVVKNLTVPFPYTMENAISWIKGKKKGLKNCYYFAIVRKSDNVMIGGTSLCVKEDKNSDNGGIWLNSNFHGQGYGTEAWTAMAKLWFEDKNNACIISGYFDYNKASEKLHKKIGYKVVGHAKQFCPALNKDVDETRVILLRKDFEKYYNSINFELSVK